MSSFGAGNLNSYMGGGGDYETPTQSSYSGNMQTLFLILAAGVIIILLVTNFAGSGLPGTGGPGGPGDGTDGQGGTESTAEPSELPGFDSDTTGERDESEILYGIDLSKYGINQDEFVPQEDLSEAELFENLKEMKMWKPCGDSDLVLKLLEAHTFKEVDLYSDDDDY